MLFHSTLVCTKWLKESSSHDKSIHNLSRRLLLV